TSIGLNKWEESPYISNNEIRRAVKGFSKILLREDSGIRIANEVFNVEAQQVIDPVLLFPSYPELTGEIQPSSEIVTYKLINDEGFYDMARTISSSLSLPIRSIGSVRKPAGYRASYPESVENWIKRIAGASIVMTDSFHGTVISLLYHRLFIVYVGDPRRITRIVSLLTQLGLRERIMTKENTIVDFKRLVNQPIDWGIVDEKLSKLRSLSFELLRSSLS
ncbi:MAG: polysaccharide pyruvyl transferase family protein, partial [Muribaculaceae bacterium]|nr:polysaccharide pyruvyl transferase family protein [Muribaculaceae bacterium]